MKQDSGLYPYRRHLRTCQFFGPGGREVRSDKCNCPFHVEGVYRGQRPRRSLKTRGRQIADRKLADLVRTLDAKLDADDCNGSAISQVDALPKGRTLSDAVDRFLLLHGSIVDGGEYRGDSAHGTWRKYRSSLRFLVSFCGQTGISQLTDLTIEVLEDYRQSRRISQITWKVELQALRTFFAHCVSRKWLSTNPAKELKAPRNLRPNEVVPYTLLEEGRILEACDQIGGGKYNRSGAAYEQRRARTMIMLLRHTALRISDVCTLRKDAISWDQKKDTWRVHVRTQKSGERVYLPIPLTLKMLLDSLPLPRNAAMECPYYFWNAQSGRRAVVGTAERTLSAVFRKSAVKNAHAHRYRHTLATRLLEQGATLEEVATILGNTPEVVRKHYAKWSPGQQDNIDRLMIAHFGTVLATNSVTKKSHENLGVVN